MKVIPLVTSCRQLTRNWDNSLTYWVSNCPEFKGFKSLIFFSYFFTRYEAPLQHICTGNKRSVFPLFSFVKFQPIRSVHSISCWCSSDYCQSTYLLCNTCSFMMEQSFKENNVNWRFLLLTQFTNNWCNHHFSVNFSDSWVQKCPINQSDTNLHVPFEGSMASHALLCIMHRLTHVNWSQ